MNSRYLYQSERVALELNHQHSEEDAQEEVHDHSDSRELRRPGAR